MTKTKNIFNIRQLQQISSVVLHDKENLFLNSPDQQHFLQNRAAVTTTTTKHPTPTPMTTVIVLPPETQNKNVTCTFTCQHVNVDQVHNTGPGSQYQCLYKNKE